jgi:2-polyprenyl-6-methoxyphenol hydroxylase-like FAD-dependent oxidoreductase
VAEGENFTRVAAGGEWRRPRAVVVGAGIAGLATALRLSQIGWESVVIERAPGRRNSGYMVNLLGQGYDAADRLGILPALAPRDVGAFNSIMVKADGRHKLTVPQAIAQAALGERAITVFRGDLEAALYNAVRDATDIRFGTTVRTVTQGDAGVRVVLSDGSTERADLLVGADGLRSSVRSDVFGPPEEFRVDMNHVVAAFPLDRIPPDVPRGAGATFIGPRRTAAVVNLGPGRSSAFFTYRVADPDSEVARGPVHALTAAFGDLGGGVPDALEQLADNPAGAYFDSVSQVVMDRWSRGRVVLLGDAAWCVTLFAGFGAASALAGADRLGTALREHDDDVTAALVQWEAEWRPEIVKRQAVARKGMRQYAPPNQASVWMADAMMRLVTLPGFRGLVLRSAQRSAR